MNKKSFPQIQGFFVLVLALVSASAVQAQPQEGFRPYFAEDPYPRTGYFSLAVKPPAYCAGKRIYALSVVPSVGTFAIVSPNEFVLWEGGEIPHYKGSVATDGAITLVSEGYTRPEGRELWVGCGNSTYDMLMNLQYERVLPASSRPAEVYQIGQVAEIQNVPNAAKVVGSEAWKISVTNRKIAILESGLKLVGNDRPTKVAVFSVLGVTYLQFLDAEYGTPIGCIFRFSATATHIVGTSTGVVFAFLNCGNACNLFTELDQSSTRWGIVVPCQPDGTPQEPPEPSSGD